MTEWKDWRKNDIIFGIILPTVIVFLILIITTEVRAFFDATFPDPSGQSALTAILIDSFGETILIVAIPMFLGLLWNQWAGGASGFLLGSIYALYVNDTYAAFQMGLGSNMMIGDISCLGYVVTAILVGYMAGALNRGSFSFRRMVVSALIAAVISSLILVWTLLPPSLGGMSTISMITDVPYTLFIYLVPRVIFAIIVPLIATVFGWYGLTPRQMS